MFDPNKTEKATPKRRQQAFEKGQVAKSQDFATAILLLLSFCLLLSVGKNLAEVIFLFSKSLYSEKAWIQSTQETLTTFLSNTVLYFVSQCFFFGLILILTGMSVHWIQSGWLFLPENVLPDWNRINPGRGFSRIFSSEGVLRIVMGLIKIAICCGIIVYAIYANQSALLRLGSQSIHEITSFFGSFLIGLGIQISLALLILSGLDLFYQRWKLEQDLKMTPQEIREEMRESLGNPEIQTHRKQLLAQMRQDLLALIQFFAGLPASKILVLTSASPRSSDSSPLNHNQAPQQEANLSANSLEKDPLLLWEQDANAEPSSTDEITVVIQWKARVFPDRDSSLLSPRHADSEASFETVSSHNLLSQKEDDAAPSPHFAPFLIAKGTHLQSKQILRLAQRFGLPVLVQKDFAQKIFQMTAESFQLNLDLPLSFSQKNQLDALLAQKKLLVPKK